MEKPLVIILVGGKSSRFINDEIKVKFVPKSLSLINGKSILFNIINHFRKEGFRKFLLPLGHYKDLFINQIKKETKNMYKINNLKHDISKNDDELEIFFLKTNLKLNKAERIQACLNKVSDQDFIVAYGDALGDIKLKKMYQIFKKNKKHCLAAGYKINSQYGHYANHKNQQRFLEKPILDSPINIGYFFFKNSVKHIFKKKCKKDLERGIIKSLYENDQLDIFMHNGFWKSIDTYKEYMDLKKIYEK